jgi:hypothetical protein
MSGSRALVALVGWSGLCTVCLGKFVLWLLWQLGFIGANKSVYSCIMALAGDVVLARGAVGVQCRQVVRLQLLRDKPEA